MRYNAYWVAVNDIQTTPLGPQKLVAGTTIGGNFNYNTVDTLSRVLVNYLNYAEVPLGQFNFTKFGNRDFCVYGPPTASSTSNVDAITLDYIKLVPAF